MPPRPITQRVLFEDADAAALPQLQPDLRPQLLQQMVPWMQAVAVAINEEARDEQNHR